MYLGCIATSAPIERIFSIAGMATRGYKNRTEAKLLNDRFLVYTNRNMFVKLTLIYVINFTSKFEISMRKSCRATKYL